MIQDRLGLLHQDVIGLDAADPFKLLERAGLKITGIHVSEDQSVIALVCDPDEMRVRADWLVTQGESLGEYLQLNAELGRHVITVESDADCCSETWFADVVGVEALFSETVTSTRTLDLPDSLRKELDDEGNPRTRQECDAFYGWELSTRKGRITIAVRNSSNGYYGGWLTFAGLVSLSDVGSWETITEDWSA